MSYHFNAFAVGGHEKSPLLEGPRQSRFIIGDGNRIVMPETSRHPRDELLVEYRSVSAKDM